jgi:hypothetical protein
VRSPDVPYDNFPYQGSFTFARIKFEPTEWGPGPYFWGWDLKWNHDYPWAEQNFMKILDELTLIHPTMDGGNIYAADDPELFDYPLAYLCEVGFWNPTESEVRGLRDYLLKGGSLVIDDFAALEVHGVPFRAQRRGAVQKGHLEILAHFAEAVSGRSQPEIGPDDGYWATWCAEQSLADLGQPVAPPPA